jgi:hypothetical protein
MVTGRSAPVLVHVWFGPLLEPGPELAVHAGACAARIRDALDRLPALERYTVDHAPAG